MEDDPCQQASITWLTAPTPQKWSMAGPSVCVVSTVGRVVSSAHPGQLLVSPYTASILDTMTFVPELLSKPWGGWEGGRDKPVSSCSLNFQESVPGGCPSGGHLPRYKHHHSLLSFQDAVPQTPLRSAISAPRSFHAISECSQLRAGSYHWP